MIDGEGECTANLGVVERGIEGVDTEIAGTDIRFLAEFGSVFFLGQRDELGWHGVSEVQLLVSKHPSLGIVISDGEVAYTIQFHLFGIPVVRVALDLEEVVGSPGFEFERTIGDDVFRLGPWGGIGGVNFTVFEDDMFGDRIPGVVLGDLQEVWCRAT